jgi:hypothetical protein
MDLMKFLKERWHREAVHLPAWQLPAVPPARARSGENYFRLTLTEMFLADDRKWFAGWQPVLYAAINFRFGDKTETINHVAGTSSLKDVDASKLNQGVALNFSITPLVPFNGGEIEIEVGLVAMKGDDDVKRLLKVLGDFSKVLAVPQISTALSFAAPLADGAAELLGVAGNRPILRFHDTFNDGNPLQAMHIVIASDPDGRLAQSRMTVEQSRLLYDGKSLTGYDYMVLRIDLPAERDDWDSLSAIEEPFLASIKALQDALAEPDAKKRKALMNVADRQLGAAKLAAYNAKELTKIVGRNQVIKTLQGNYDAAKLALGAAGAAEVAIPRNLKEALANCISVADAKSFGELRIEEFFEEEA